MMKMNDGYIKNIIAVMIEDFLSAKFGAAIIMGDIMIIGGQGMHMNVTRIFIKSDIVGIDND